MKKHILISVLLLIIGTGLIQCSPMEKKYDYSIDVTSADGYQCYISWSGCYMGEAQIPFSAGGSWGEGRSAVASGPEMKSLPGDIRLIYYSLTENRFYKLESVLDKEKIRPLLDAAYKQEDYDDATFFTFTIGIAPRGFVSLWLSGDAGKVLLDTYHAKETEYNYHSAFPTDVWNQEKVFEEYSKDLYPFIRKEMTDNRISSAYWESLNKSYNWKIQFSDKDFSLYDYRIYLLNQERRFFLTDPSWPVTDGKKYAPAELTLYLQHRLDPIKYKVIIKLREQYITYPKDVEKEITVLNHMNKSRSLLKFFDDFYRKAGDQEVSIYLDFDFSMDKLKLKLKSGDYEEEFPDYTYKIYDSERYNYR